ncbi:MAG: DUF1501 domain-containing protein [Verrucomicrobia bacterium]|nr:DUF1501 domain-containing protein [Verrucomicrobiota bacterium]
MKTNRRKFLMGCSAAIAAMAGSRLGCFTFSSPLSAASNQEVLVLVFLRGGMDGLSLIPPIAGDDRQHYEEARRDLKIPVSGTGAALRLDDRFGLHPSAGALHALFQSGKLAIVHAVGSAGSRSHFDAMKYLELGTPGSKTIPTGWLARHLSSSGTVPGPVLASALATGISPPTSLQGSNETLNLSDPGTLNLSHAGHWSWVFGDQRIALRRLYRGGNTFVHEAGLEALDAVGLIESYLTPDYQPSGSANYPATEFGKHLKIIAQMIKLDVGLRVATVDLGGWDTHENQGTAPGGYFANLVQQLSDGLAAFYSDLDGSQTNSHPKRLTIVIQSEFGRRIRQNANRGTDHGTANPMLILGGNVNGGLYGTWPGLHPDQRFDSADLKPTTDFRQLLSEVLIRRFGNPRLGEVFPNYRGYLPLNIVSGPDVPPDYSVPIPATPANLLANKVSGVVRLSWEGTHHATSYRLERRAEASDSWEHLATLGAEAVQFDDWTASAGTSPSYRLQAINTNGESPFTAPVTPPNLKPIEQWRFEYFGTTQGTGEAADDRILTGDGLPNFVKYALGLDPRVRARSFTTGFTPGRPRTEVNGNSCSLVFVRPVDRPDVRYEVRLSSDLKTWTAVPDVSDGTADGMERRRATVARDSLPAQFLQLMIGRA